MPPLTRDEVEQIINPLQNAELEEDREDEMYITTFSFERDSITLTLSKNTIGGTKTKQTKIDIDESS